MEENLQVYPQEEGVADFAEHVSPYQRPVYIDVLITVQATDRREMQAVTDQAQ